MINKAVEDLKARVDKQVEIYFKAENKSDNIRRITEQNQAIGVLREMINISTILCVNDIISYEASKEIIRHIDKALEKIYNEIGV
jgi:hypothetical protein